MEPVVLTAGQGELVVMGAGGVAIKATGAQTGGTFYLGECELAGGFEGPPPHTHERLHDMFFVLEGTLTMRLGDEEHELAPGTFVCVPPTVVHTFSNPGPAPVRFLNFNTPSGWEGYMRDVANLSRNGTNPSGQEIGEIAARYDFHVVRE
jgi:mannose-6-phosphate isomerase-like protein (cupin superfamily)